MDYAKLCNSLLDYNEKIRYVGVYNSFSGDVYEKMQNGTVRHFDKDQTKKSMTQAIMRWENTKTIFIRNWRARICHDSI